MLDDIRDGGRGDQEPACGSLRPGPAIENDYKFQGTRPLRRLSRRAREEPQDYPQL
ncbi:hypothetical protein [Caballeronia arationis]|jgi:hypothetical protein|uniref:hypothetical protein n=1 Tax=Caballeronia arationis TaxID=1777142 RepID=UPI00135BC7E9|nr:hypothetical protein [Caballeronia arationis]